MPNQFQDPMLNYRKYIKSPDNKLKIQPINMSTLRKIYSKLNKSNSVSYDKISMKTLDKLKMLTQPIF